MSMEYEVAVGEVWQRERDGMVGRVESVEPGSHGYVRWRPSEGGRLRWNWKWEFVTAWNRQDDLYPASVSVRLDARDE